MIHTTISTRTRLARGAIAAAIAASVIALAPGVAASAVPKAQWYWTLVAPGPGSNVLLLGTSNGVYRSSDGGKTWRASGLAGVNATSLVQDGGTTYAGGVREQAGEARSPVTSVNGSPVVAAGPGVLEASTDAGLSWQTLHPSGLPSSGLSALATEPASGGALYAVLRDGAVYRSTDGAHSFSLVSTKIAGAPWALAVTEDGRLIGGDMRSGSYLSPNGTAWQHTAFVDPDGTKMVMEYAVDPGELTRVLMTSYGIVLSTNSGASWQVSLKSKVMFGPIAWASASPGIVYAVGFDGSLWRSGNSGKSWSKVA